MKEALLYASTFIIEDNLMWFVPIRYNYLCCYNFTTEKVEKKFRLPEGNYYFRMYDKIFNYEEKLYLIPFNGSNVLIFDKKRESFQQISTAPFDSIKYKFCAATIYQNTLYMFPERVAAEIENPYIVVRVDLTGEDVQVVEVDVPVVPAGNPYYEVFDRQYFVAEGFVYILLQRTNRVLEYSLEENSTKIYDVGGSENRYATMYMDGDAFYFIDQDGDVTMWDKQDDRFSKYENQISGYTVENKSFAAFSASFKHGDRVYFVPRFANKVLCFDNTIIKESFFSSEVLGCSNIVERKGIARYFLDDAMKNGKLYLWDFSSYKFYIVNMTAKTCEAKEITTIFNDDELKCMYCEFIASQIDLYHEDIFKYFNLEFYLRGFVLGEDAINEGEENNAKQTLQRGHNGKDIYYNTSI